jgi:hypothetical protein
MRMASDAVVVLPKIEYKCSVRYIVQEELVVLKVNSLCSLLYRKELSSRILCGLTEKRSQTAHVLYSLLLYTDLHIKRSADKYFIMFTAWLFGECVH